MRHIAKAILSVLTAAYQAGMGLIGMSPLEVENHHAGVRTDGGADKPKGHR